MNPLIAPKPKRESLSVVIATIGNDNLRKTIDSVNAGTIVPDEIIICVPDTEFYRVTDLCYKNVRFCITSYRGQVAQRLAGFREAKNSFVLQLDDDVCLDPTCIEKLLVTACRLGAKVAVGPSLMDLSTNYSIYARKKPFGHIGQFYIWVLNGRRGFAPGTITRSGLNFGWDPDGSDTKIFSVDWIAGGCVLHRRENLVLENFFPFKGKAYCEDLFHSQILISRGVALYIDSNAKCFIRTNDNDNLHLTEFLKEIRSDFRARKLLVKMNSLDLPRMYFYYAIRCIKYVAKSAFNLVNRFD
jgi:GT2 family glycosyltransferase